VAPIRDSVFKLNDYSAFTRLIILLPKLTSLGGRSHLCSKEIRMDEGRGGNREEGVTEVLNVHQNQPAQLGSDSMADIAK
jgi:hypothetical protein